MELLRSYHVLNLEGGLLHFVTESLFLPWGVGVGAMFH